MKRVFLFFLVFIILIVAFAIGARTDAFVQGYRISSWDPPGFLSGVWHGLLAPYSLIARWFIDDVQMYALPNTGWFYDLGFLFGISGSLPIGWFAAILSVLLHLVS
ncbi:MAG: hypothetical protein AAB533_00325 [Patescibacteria group bacterium]